jgi:ribosomal protein S18 acetylase RimI-like enzyme
MATEVVLRDGSSAWIWPLLPQDRDALREAFARMDPKSRYDRFLAAVPYLSNKMLRDLVDAADGVDHVALVMVGLAEDGTDIPAAVGHIIRYSRDPDAADVAVTVAEEFRGRGAASALLAALVAARPEGVTRIETEVAADNIASLRMLRRLGATEVSSSGPATCHVHVDLHPQS